MKVMCISKPKDKEEGHIPIIQEGEIYHVASEDDYFGYEYYELAEHLNYWYARHLFVPCSDIDETELIKERENVLV